MSKDKVLVFHSDSGHGWLAVKRIELEKLEILNDISRYSYQKGNTVYLEEDCDAGVYFKALQQLGLSRPQYRESYQENSPIRGYNRFKK